MQVADTLSQGNGCLHCLGEPIEKIAFLFAASNIGLLIGPLFLIGPSLSRCPVDAKRLGNLVDCYLFHRCPLLAKIHLRATLIIEKQRIINISRKDGNMEKEIMTSIITAGAALSGVAVSQLGGIVRSLFDKNNERTVLLRSKLEELADNLHRTTE
ncbi:hypothetical protein [Desulfobulbus propionicus]|uniref:hypothetical protein n=1 Tax=Desulfobulbus propionicus TaxID=894 RepID=UPI00146E3B30|nr:hypothetical protein [Desulfobulbus propionicus]